MALHINDFTPSSAFFASQSFSDRLINLRQNAFVSKSPSRAYNRSSHFTDDIVNRLDRIDTLGGEDINGNSIGHDGCVNALAWSQSGHCLATGSDDRRIILWKLGSSDEHPQSYDSKLDNDTRGCPKLDIAQSDIIETGHRANIFNVKWAPNCSDQRLLTVAGDSQIRVFDLNRASTTSVEHRLKSGKEYRLWQEGRGACTRVLRCHTGRAKKISTENSPDIFLTAAEDGEVRQTDLRVPHTCSRSQSYGQGCPRPLVQFKMELYSISISIQEPWLFAVAGTSDKVYLQDRRMIPRLLKNEWGSYIDEETAALTQCVRRFCREPKVVDDEQSAAARVLGRAHVTAVKISEANGRDLLASYSGDGVYRFDLKGEPGMDKKADPSTLPENKKRKSSDTSVRFRSISMSKAKQNLEAQWSLGRAQVGVDPDIEMQGQSTNDQPIVAAQSGSGSDGLLTEEEMSEVDRFGSDGNNEEEEEEEEEGEEEDDDDDDDEEEEDDSDSGPRFSESDDEPEMDRHGISGGNAPFVYPNGCFTGHANNETVKDCGFIGSNDEYIWSGSDCGHFFIWTNDQKRKLMGIWKGDGSVTNALTQHPVLPIFACSGIDNSIKIFGPVSNSSRRRADAMDRKDEIIRSNSQHERVTFNPQRIRQIFARQMGLLQAGGEAGEEDEEEDCTIM